MTHKRDPTDWEILQARIGNGDASILKDERKGAASQYKDKAEVDRERMERQFEHAIMEKLDVLAEDDDEDFLRKFREKRQLEMKLQAERNRFGELYEVAEPDYKQQVTNEQSAPVVVLLFKHGVGGCELLESRLRPLAQKFRSTKFVKIRADAAIRGYPDSNLPTLLIYNKGDIVSQIVTLEPLGGSSVSSDDIEWTLVQAGAVEGSDMFENPRDVAAVNSDDENGSTGIGKKDAFRIGFKARRGGREEWSESDDEGEWGVGL